jgi:hypothetical protein
MGFFKSINNFAKSVMGDTKAMIEQGHWMMKNGQTDAAINCFSGAAIKGDQEAMVLWGNSLIQHGNSDVDTMGGLVQIYKAVIIQPSYSNHLDDALAHRKTLPLLSMNDAMLDNLKAAVLSNPYRAADDLDRRATDMVIEKIKKSR